MTCNYCGSQLHEGAQFCGVCGRQQPSPAPGKKRPGKGLIITLVAAVLAGASAFLPDFGGSTEYLRTGYTIESDSWDDEYSYKYDEEGRLVRYSNVCEYKGDLEYLGEYKESWEYEYEDGRIVAAEFENEDFSFELEYTYDKDGNLKSVESDDFEGDVECDEEGRITQIEVDGIFDFYGEYSYYDNGMLKELETRSDGVKTVESYDEEGRLLESKVYFNGDINNTSEYVYNDKGKLESCTLCYYSAYYDTKTETVYSYEYDKKGNAVGYFIEFSENDAKLNVECKVETEDNVMTYVITKISGDEEAAPYITENLKKGDTYMEVERDDHGNLVRSTAYASGKTETTYTYKEFEAPRGYKVPSESDIIFFQFLV